MAGPVICPVFVGRARDLEVLHAILDRVRRGSGQTVLLSGEAGVGKSRLVAEAKAYAAAHGFLSLRGNCFQPDVVCPYAPLLDLVRAHFTGHAIAALPAGGQTLARELAQRLPDVASRAGDVHADDGGLPPFDPQQEKRGLFRALEECFLALAAHVPLLLIVEDLHWSDDISLEFLLYLARRITAQPLLLLLTYRSDEVRPGLSHFLAELDRERLATENALPRLSMDEVDTMLRAMLALERPVRAEFLQAIYTLTDGNPFFVEETLRALTSGGDIDPAAWDRKPVYQLRIPRSIQDAIRRRLQQLSPAAVEVVSLAAVVGRRFDFGLLQQLMQCGEKELLRLVKELIAAQLVVEESAEIFAFRHALTRESIYFTLLARERKSLHRTIAETLEQSYADALEAHVAELAYHFYHAGMWQQVILYAQRAGEQAQALYAPHAAVEHFTWALEASHRLSAVPPPHVLRSRGQAYETMGDFEQAQADLEQALQIACEGGDPREEWQTLLDLGLLWTSRDYPRAGEHFRRALDLARGMQDQAILARSLNRLGNWYANAERPRDARQYHREALSIFEGLNDRRGMAETLDLLGSACYMSDDLSAGTTYTRRAAVLFEEQGNRQGLASALAMLALDGLAGEAELALRIAREIGWRSGEAFALIRLGFCLGEQGEYARALELLQAGLEIAQAIQHQQWMTAAHFYLGELYRDLLWFTAAEQQLRQALALAQATSTSLWVHIVSARLAALYLLQNQAARAEALLHAAFGDAGPGAYGDGAPGQSAGQHQAWCVWSELALATGRPELALRMAGQLLASEASRENPGDRSTLHAMLVRSEALATLRRPAEAEATLQAVAEAARAKNAQPLQWRIALALGKLYHAQGRHEEAEAAFSSVRATIARLALRSPTKPCGSGKAASRPLVAEQLRVKRKGHAGRSWHTNETYIKVGGVWKYLYRAIDRDGNLIDSMLREHRDMEAAKRFFKSALEIAEQVPERVTTDGHDSYPRAIRETLCDEVIHRCNPYLNNRIEQDHRGVKQRYYPMRGFGNVDSAARFCRAFDEQRHYFRLRNAMRQRVPPLAEQRKLYWLRFQTLMGALVAA